jgi:cytochrome c556
MRKSTIIAVLLAALVTPTVKAADVTEADFEKGMKDVLAGMQSVGKSMRESTGDLSGAVAGAKAIDAALGAAESFWVARKAQGAVDMNKAARTAAQAVAKAAGTNDTAATGEAMKGLQATCKSCHDVHREQLPDKTYRIKQ